MPGLLEVRSIVHESRVATRTELADHVQGASPLGLVQNKVSRMSTPVGWKVCISVSVELIAAKIQRRDFAIGDLDADGIDIGVQLGVDGQSGLGCGGGDQCDPA